MAIDSYLNLVTSQHRDKPKFIAWLSAALSTIDDNVQMALSIPSVFDVDNAVGAQLDVIGQVVGRSRVLRFQPQSGMSPVLDDINYRIALKAKIAQNQWDGTIPQIYEIWNNLFPDVSLTVVDNQDMTMSVLVDGQIDPVVTDMVAAGYIVPKPAGVALTIIQVTHVSSTPFVGAVVSEFETVQISTIKP